MVMRIHTPKLKGPHPLLILGFCLLWPAAAMVAAITSHSSTAAQSTPQSVRQTVQNTPPHTGEPTMTNSIAAQSPKQPQR